MIKISVLVPVYNVEPFIEKCILSIQNQTFTDFECIIVNDCTPDRSIEIIEPIIQNDARFHIVHHGTNKGLGEARNTALKYAVGEYVTFIDSDDFVEPKYLEQFYEVITTSKAGIVDGRFVGHRYSKKEIKKNNGVPRNYLITISEILSGKIGTHVMNKMYKTSLFQNYKFPHGNYEDACANLLLIAQEKIEFIPRVQEATYHFVERKGSITHSSGRKQINDFVENVLCIPIQELSKCHYNQEYLGKFLCVYAFVQMTYLLRTTWLYSQNPNSNFVFIKSKILRDLPNFVLRFFQIKRLYSIVFVFHYNLPFVIFLLFPIIRLYLNGSRWWLFLYSLSNLGYTIKAWIKNYR